MPREGLLDLERWPLLAIIRLKSVGAKNDGDRLDHVGIERVPDAWARPGRPRCERFDEGCRDAVGQVAELAHAHRLAPIFADSSTGPAAPRDRHRETPACDAKSLSETSSRAVALVPYRSSARFMLTFQNVFFPVCISTHTEKM